MRVEPMQVRPRVVVLRIGYERVVNIVDLPCGVLWRDVL